MAVLKSWLSSFRHNVEDEFWVLLEAALRTNIRASGEIDSVYALDVDKLLYPESLLIAYVETIYDMPAFELAHDTARTKRIYQKIVSDDGPYVQPLKNVDELRKFVELRLFGSSHVGERVPNLRRQLRSRACRGSSKMAPQLRILLEDAVAQQRIVTLTEVYELCMRSYKERADDNAYVRMQPPTFYAQAEINIRKKIFGQDRAVDTFVRGMFAGDLAAGDLAVGDKKAPHSTYLFVGPPGVGKTYLANVAAEALGLPFRVYHMGEYAHDQSFHGLVGFESTWKDSTPGTLTSFVSMHPNAVLIFDEIEKAHVNTLRQFLPLLEGGVVHDLFYDLDIDFTNTVCIFTTNAGKDFYEENRKRKISAIPEETILDALKKDKDVYGNPTIPTELLSRFAKGHIVGFDHMDPYTLLPIIKAGVCEAKNLLQQRTGIEVCIDRKTMDTLCLVLMFHLGGKLDARVASSRSRTFLIDAIYSMLEAESYRELTNTGDDDRVQTSAASTDVWAPWRGKRVRLAIEDNDELVKSLLVLDESHKQHFIIIDYNKNQKEAQAWQEGRDYEVVDGWFDRDESEKRRKIDELIESGKPDAILVNPEFSLLDEPQEHEGIHNKPTRANMLLEWLTEREQTPPIYLLVKDEQSYLERNLQEGDAYRAMGVEGFTHFKADDLDALALRLFHLKNLRSVTSNGRALQYKTDYKLKANSSEIVVELHDFLLVSSLDTDAADIVVNKTAGAKRGAFDNIIGAESAKEELRRFIRFLNNPDSYLHSGLSVSKGILLYGPPGTGKTMLARALAAEADCPFIPVSGADVTAERQGDGKVRDVGGLFALARKYAPAVLFIDEIDAFARPRKQSNAIDVAKVNKMLTEMDGFNVHKDEPVFVIAATNRTPEELDSALMRRFTKKVRVDNPNGSERLEFLRLMQNKLEGKRFDLRMLNEGDLKRFAGITVGSSFAEIKNAIEIAQGKALEDGSHVTYATLQDCYEESQYGAKLDNIDETIRYTAYHEAGHAIMGFAAGRDFWPEYATVVARRAFLGAVVSNLENINSFTKDDLLAMVRIRLGGRAAEVVFFGDRGIDSGAASDLGRATQLVVDMLCRYGMDDGFPVSIDPELAFSGRLAEKYHARASEILQREFDATVAYLQKHKDQVEALGSALIDKTRLNTAEMCRILGKQAH